MKGTGEYHVKQNKLVTEYKVRFLSYVGNDDLIVERDDHYYQGGDPGGDSGEGGYD